MLYLKRKYDTSAILITMYVYVKYIDYQYLYFIKLRLARKSSAFHEYSYQYSRSKKP